MTTLPRSWEENLPRGHLRLCRSTCRRNTPWHPITSTITQLSHLTQVKLFTRKIMQFGDPHAHLHTVNVLVHLCLTFLFAAICEEGEKNGSLMLKWKDPRVNNCCSAFLTSRALHMFGVGSVTQRDPSGSTEQQAPWQWMQHALKQRGVCTLLFCVGIS